MRAEGRSIARLRRRTPTTRQGLARVIVLRYSVHIIEIDSLKLTTWNNLKPQPGPTT